MPQPSSITHPLIRSFVPTCARAGAACARRIDQIAALDEASAHALQDAVETAFACLLRDLRAAERPASATS